MTTTQIHHFASELRYLGKGTIEARNADGTVMVNIDGMGRGKVAADMIFRTKREAREFAAPPMVGGWSDVARLNRI